jgi:peptide/nickel transport system substrate-binding protein
MKKKSLWLMLCLLLVAGLVLSSSGEKEVAPEPEVGKLKEVPRNRTLMIIWWGREGRWIDHELWNPYNLGAHHQRGPGIFYEPLYYYSAFADKEIPWLAKSFEYSRDMKELTYHLRPNVTWSDGKPFTAEDVAFTLNSLRDLGPKVIIGVDVAQFLDKAVVVDPLTVKLMFKVPAPKFHHFMSYKYDIGVYMVPKHIFEGKDWPSFKHFDVAKGLPVTTSPWRVVRGAPEEKIIDRVASKDDWWASKTGFAELPKVERIIYLPHIGETQTAEALITNVVDYTYDLRPHTMTTVLEKNPKIITHVGNKPPYGYVDWWPIGLMMNCEKPHISNKNVRWAISYYIDRDEIVDVGWGGAGTPSKVPWPSYPGLKPFTDAISDLLEKYPTTEYNPAKGDERLRTAGYTKDKDGYWVDAAGSRIKVEMISWEAFADIGPVVAARLRKHGIDASFAMPADFWERPTTGDFYASTYGHGGSVAADPYFTLRLYQSATVAVPGMHVVNWYRWHNEEYDRIVDEMVMTSMEDTEKLKKLTHDAMEILLDELPDAQLVEWYHRIPMNTTYWTGWPTEDDPYVNGAFWHLTFNLILNRLEPTQ